MKKSVLITSLIIVVVAMAACGSGGGESGKPLTDKDVLLRIYKANNGVNWPENAQKNWNSEEPIGQWAGVKTNEEGRVTELRLTNDSLKGIFPKEIGQLSELKILWLRMRASETGEQPFPASIGDLVNLENLSLSGGVKNAELVFPPLGKMSSLKTLYLGGEARTPEGFGLLQSLVDVEFSGNIGDLPAELSKLVNLERIFIRGSAFTGQIPADIGNLKKLKFLLIDKMLVIGRVEPLQGELPASIWDLENIDRIFLRSASTGGSLPADISKLTKLAHITILECGLTGEIPQSLYTMQQLQAFSVYNNKLTGTISPEIGNLTALTEFSVYNNQLTGTLPSSMGKMVKLRTLQVQKNQLTGTIPAELANCPLDGVFVDFSENQFSDNIAAALKAHPRFDKWKFKK